MAGGKVNVEPGDQRMDKVVATHVQRKGRGEGQVGGCDGVEIEGEDGRGIGDDGLDFHRVDQRFGEGGVLEWGKVEAVDVIPD